MIEGQSVSVGGDVILAMDGQSIKTFDDLVTYLTRSTEVGQTVPLTVLRDGKEETLKVTLSARPASQTQSGQTENNASAGLSLGINGVTLTPEIARAMNLPPDQQGVLVEQVESGSPAEQAGLVGSYRSLNINGHHIQIGGDIIVAMDGQAVASVAELQTRLQQDSPGQVVALTILRNGLQMEVQATLGESLAVTP
jgi:S1-C subfamily serine protease